MRSVFKTIHEVHVQDAESERVGNQLDVARENLNTELARVPEARRPGLAAAVEAYAKARVEKKLDELSHAGRWTDRTAGRKEGPAAGDGLPGHAL